MTKSEREKFIRKLRKDFFTELIIEYNEFKPWESISYVFKQYYLKYRLFDKELQTAKERCAINELDDIVKELFLCNNLTWYIKKSYTEYKNIDKTKKGV